MAIPKIDTAQLRSFISRFTKFDSPKPADAEVVRKVGLNIGRSNLVACEVLWQGNRPVLEKCAKKQIVQDQPLSEQIKNFFAEAGFKSKRVSTSLKGQGVVIRFLSFPKMSRADFASSIRFEAEKYLPFSLADVYFDYQIMADVNPSGNETTMPVVLAAARKTEVDRLIQTIQAAGLKPDLIDVDVLASSNAFLLANPDAKNHCFALIDLGAADSSFGILDKGNLVFSRDIAFGGIDLTEMIHRKLNISHEQALELQTKLDPKQTDKIAVVEEGLTRLFQEIRSSITYYYNQQQTEVNLEAIYISGGLSCLSVLPKLLEQRLELPVKTWNPAEQIKMGEGFNTEILGELAPYLPVSIGLATRSQ